MQAYEQREFKVLFPEEWTETVPNEYCKQWIVRLRLKDHFNIHNYYDGTTVQFGENVAVLQILPHRKIWWFKLITDQSSEPPIDIEIMETLTVEALLEPYIENEIDDGNESDSFSEDSNISVNDFHISTEESDDESTSSDDSDILFIEFKDDFSDD